jgi:hypothetical protein
MSQKNLAQRALHRFDAGHRILPCFNQFPPPVHRLRRDYLIARIFHNFRQRDLRRKLPVFLGLGAGSMALDSVEIDRVHAARAALRFETMAPTVKGGNFGIFDAKFAHPFADPAAEVLRGLLRLRAALAIEEARRSSSARHEIDEFLLDERRMKRDVPIALLVLEGPSLKGKV